MRSVVSTLAAVVVFLALLCVPNAALAQNTNAAASANAMLGQTLKFYLPDAATERWYNYQLRPGRSYCVEAWTDLEYSYGQSDTKIYVYKADATTLVASNDDIATEPDANLQSRACWIAAPTEGIVYYVKAMSYAAGYFAGRLVETSLYCPWFYTAGDYDGYVLLRNTTSEAVTVTVTWRTPTGAIASGNGKTGTYTGSIPSHGLALLTTKTYVSTLTTTSGSIEVAFAAAPGAITGSTTTLSGTTGISFDALFSERKYR